MDESLRKQNNHVLITTLQAIKKASKQLQRNPISLFNYFLPLIKALLILDDITKKDPKLFNLSFLFLKLKNLLDSLKNPQGCFVRSIIHKQLNKYEIFRVASDIEREVITWIDEIMVRDLVTVMEENGTEEAKVEILKDFESRVSQGFNKGFQELVLQSNVFLILEKSLCFGTCCKQVLKEQITLAMAALVRFNKHVFGGLVFMGPTVPVLVQIGSHSSIQVLCSFVELIKVPFVDEMQSSGQIEKIVTLLSSDEFSIKEAALDCILAIGHFGRKEVIEELLDLELVKQLMELERSDNGDSCEGVELMKNNGQFSSCVTRFVAKLERGEGLEENEKRELRWEILKRVKESSVSQAEAVDIIQDILWNSLP